MLVRAVLIVREAVLISAFVIEEYRNKTIGLLFAYPISRTKLIIAKLFLICGIMFLPYVLSNIFQYISIFLAKKCFDFVTFSFGNILVQTVTTISFVLLGFFPLYVGIIKKSTIATVVSSIVIVAIASNSQGSNTGLMSMPVVAIIFGMIGVIFSVVPVPSVEIMLCGDKIVGISMDGRMTKELVISARKDAICHTKTTAGCILHSDRGSQYCSLDYQELAKEYGFISSMSRKGNCWDNAPMESFWGKLKQEWLNEQHFRTREEAKSAVFEYIWIFYNRKRIHEANGYLTPEEYYRIHQTDLKAA